MYVDSEKQQVINAFWDDFKLASIVNYNQHTGSHLFTYYGHENPRSTQTHTDTHTQTEYTRSLTWWQKPVRPNVMCYSMDVVSPTTTAAKRTERDEATW